MITDVELKMMDTIIHGQRSAVELEKVLLENQTTLIGSNPTVTGHVNNVIDSFTHLYRLIYADSPASAQHLNNNNNNRLGRSCAKGKEVATVIERDTQDYPDGHSWRKYGEKKIKNFTHPRSYYKCAFKKDKNCAAKKWVQKSEVSPSKYINKYVGVHTCQAVVFSNPVNDDASSSNMIQFNNQDQTMANSCFPMPSLEDIVHQETVAANPAMNQVYDGQFSNYENLYPPYGNPMFFNSDFYRTF